MGKGYFSQGIAVLTTSAPSLEALTLLLSGETVTKRPANTPAAGPGPSWLGGDSLLVAIRPEVNGYALIDVVTEPWPDHMGDPKSAPELFAAWTMGGFGPFAFPGGLGRAAQQSWHWDGAQSAVAAHRSFVRVRMSYCVGAGPDALVMPKDCNPQQELEALMRLGQMLLNAPEALALYNPSGEVLAHRGGVLSSLAFHEEHEVPPLDLWTNVRHYNVDEQWSLMDTVGNAQLDLPDIEAFFRREVYQAGEVSGFLRNTALYILKNGQIFADGHTIAGPGDINWVVEVCDEGAVTPPRPVLRFFPMDDAPRFVMPTR